MEEHRSHVSSSGEELSVLSSSETETDSECEEYVLKYSVVDRDDELDKDPELVNCDPEPDGNEDASLINWNKWINYRKLQQNFLKDSLKRNTDKMLLNSEDVYEKQTGKQLIKHAQKYVQFDKYRGDPKFWYTPNYITDKQTDLPLNCPVNEKFDRTVIDENKPPTMDYIGVPKIINDEKGIEKYKHPDEKKLTFHKCNIYDDKLLELKDNVDLIETYKPDLENLYIAGKGYHQPDPQLIEISKVNPDIPEIFIEYVEDQQEVKDYMSNDFNPVFKIQTKNKTVIINEIEDDIIFIIGYGNCLPDTLYTEILEFENIGNVVIRYTWQKIEPYKNPVLPLRYTTQLKSRFLFPTENGTCCPGQIIEIPFWFRSLESGVYNETWKLITDPKFSNDKFIIVKLQSFVKVVQDTSRLNAIENYIKYCRIQTTAAEELNKLFFDVNLESQTRYIKYFYEKDIFLFNNPDHFYEHEKVNILKELNKNLGYKTWDYSIKNLRNNILQSGSLDKKRENLTTLFKTSKALLQPHNEIDMNNEKYRCVYQILCSFFNLLEHDSAHLREVYRLNEKLNFQELEPLIEEGHRLSTRSITSKGKRSKSNTASFIKKQRESVMSNRRTSRISKQSTNSKNSNEGTEQSIMKPQKDLTFDIRQCQYKKTLFVQTRQRLMCAVDEITAIIESLKLFDKLE